MAPTEAGLLSSVFGYITREVQDFVSSATGGAVAESSTSRASRPEKRSGRHEKISRRRVRSEERRSFEQELSEDDAFTSRNLGRPQRGPHGRRRRHVHSEDDDDSSPSPRQRRAVAKSVQSRSAPAYSHAPSPTRLSPRRCQPRNAGPVHNEELRVPKRPHSASPSSPPPSTLSRVLKRRPSFTMPGSLFPRSESLEPDDIDDDRHARFAPDIQSPAPEQGTSSSYVESTIPLAGSSSSPYSISSSQPSPGLRRDNVPSTLPDTPTKRSWDAKGKGRATGADMSSLSSSLSVGQRRARDASPGHNRMLGKEKELLAVRQEHREKESLWEHEADTSGIREERDEYKEKIRLLEEEVKRLKEELAKRPTSVSGYSNIMPPPPPPPPPLPTFRSRAPTSDGDPSSLFANVRANLRHAGTPVETPINSARPPKRKGQPTVNLSSDKMAVFLTEMKSVRLRKVTGGPADLAGSSFSRLGEKRKRGEDGQEIQTLKRRLTETALPLPRPQLDLDPFSRSFSGLPSSQPVAGPSSLSRSYGSMRGWPSSSIDGTDVTPSLMSDDIEHEGDTSPDDRVPPTPPLAPAADHQPAIAGAEEEIPDIHMASPRKRISPPRPATPPRPSLSSLALDNLLDKRLPKSPLPAPTPAKPRPPARLPRRTPTRPDLYLQDSDDDPLNLPYTNSNSPEPAPPKKNKGRSMIPKKTGLQRPQLKFTRVENASSTRGGSQAPTTKTARRRTLDEELRQAEDSLSEEDFRGIDLEEEEKEVLVGVGSRNKKRGYLAHGGAGGKPVFMGVGYVEGAVDEEEEDVPRQPPRKARTASLRNRR